MAPTPSLQREAIVDAAIGILEREGADALSMRRLATELDSKPMTIYHYVPNKSALMSMALSEVAARIPWVVPEGPPRDRMIAIVTDMHERLAEVPWIIAILQQGTTVGTPALRLLDRFFDAAGESGLSDQVALDLWRALWFIVAADLQWQGVLAARRPEDRSWPHTIDPADVADMPNVTRLIPKFDAMSSRLDLRAAVTAQIDGTLARSR